MSDENAKPHTSDTVNLGVNVEHINDLPDNTTFPEVVSEVVCSRYI